MPPPEGRAPRTRAVFTTQCPVLGTERIALFGRAGGAALRYFGSTDDRSGSKPRPLGQAKRGREQLQQTARLFDDLVGADEQRRRHVEAERLGGLQVDHQLEFHGRLHGQARGRVALEDAIDVAGGAAEQIERVGTVAD
jgi:hypothetical protein